MRHSTKSYSNDLRRRVVEARLSGMARSAVALQFSVSEDSVYRWTQRYKETGDVSAMPRGGLRSPKITDMETFEAFAHAHAHSTLEQMQAAWQGDEVSQMCLSRTLKRLGWTRKKSKHTTGNATKQNARHS